MAIVSKVGIEAEYFLLNEKGEMVVPPSSWDRDGFPLLGEIRGEPGRSVAETVTNFKSREMQIVEGLYKDHSILMSGRERVPLKLYKEANRAARPEEPKEDQLAKIKNLYGLDISEYSDQIIEPSKIKSVLGMKIQGVWVSTGLHIHFSCGEHRVDEIKVDKYESVMLPIGRGPREDDEPNSPAIRVAEELSNRCIYLYRRAGYESKKKYEIYASRLNKPAIEYIVGEMDKAFFDRFAPVEAERTKYRHAGFFELKPYGFEYRSLPATEKTMAALPEITKKAFDLLNEVNEY